MEQQGTLELNLISAKDLKEPNFHSKMDVYALVSITGDSSNHNQKVKTPIDREGGNNPVWNFPIKLSFNETLNHQKRLTLQVELRRDRTPAADKDVGRVQVPLAELLNQSSGNEGKPFQNVTYQVRRRSGRRKGSLNFAYKFGDKVAAASPVNAPPPKAEPVVANPPPATGSRSNPYATAYPPPPPGQQQHPAGHWYPPPPVVYPPGQPAYGYPPGQPAYGYPPQSGHGYPPQQQQGGYGYPPQGMGTVAVLLGKFFGGFYFGDMFSGFDFYFS